MFKPFLILFLLWGINLYSQNLDYAKRIINTLTSEEYMGRGYSGKADLKSAEFIRNEFRILSALPKGENYFQNFNINANIFPGEMEVRIKETLLVPGKNYLADPSSSSIKGKFQVIRITLTDLAKPEVLKGILALTTGKAVLIDLNDTVKSNKAELENINKLIDYIKYSPALKNSLTVLWSDKKLTWSISDWQANKAVITINSTGFNSEEISEIEVDIKAKYKQKYKTQNVIAMIPGSVVPDSFLVITAHYDHLGIMGKNTYFPGANDNASGVAMMLTICRYFAANPPKYSILCIAFSAEEAGLLGSEYFVKNPLVETSKIKFLINFDLAGTGDEGIKVVNATIYKEAFEKLQSLNSENGFLSSIQPRGEACISDHCLFYLKKIPCFYIYTLGGISAYHDIYDKAETLPLTEFEDYSKLMISFLKSF
jgi:hypothetical protein